MNPQHIEEQHGAANSHELVSAEAEAVELRASLLHHVRLAEGLIRGKSEEQQIELARKFNFEMVGHAKWTLCKAAYLGVTLKSLFEGKNDKAKERIAKEVTGYSLSSARRFINFVDNLAIIQEKAAKQGLVMEEIGVNGCLELLPKEEGRGGRPRKGKGGQGPPPAETQPDGDDPGTSSAETGGDTPTAGDSDHGATTVSSAKEFPAAHDAAELTVTIRSSFHPKVPLREIMEKLANKEVTLHLALSVKAVSADESETILGEGEGAEIIEYQWSEAVSQGQEAQVPAAETEPANKDQPPCQERTVPDDKDKYF